MLSVKDLHLISESWGEVPRILYYHKLTKIGGQGTEEAISALQQAGIINDTKNIYLYSIMHPDVNTIVSFCTDQQLKPGKEFKVWYSLVNPTRALIYKGQGAGEGSSDTVSSEKIASTKFKTTAFLFTGEPSEFTKLGEIPCKIESTTIPVPAPLIMGIYEKYNLNFSKNKFNIQNITISKIKVGTLPQLFFKSNYIFIYNCKIK